MEYKGYKIEKTDNTWIIRDNDGSQVCDHMGCELVFLSEDEAKIYIDEQLS